MTGGIIFVVVVVILLFVAIYTQRDTRIKRQIRNTDAYNVQTFPEFGKGRLHGTAHKHEQLLIAPLTRRPCVAWRVEIQELVRSADNQRHWRNVMEKDAAIPFILEDEAGKALILAQGQVNMTLDEDAHFRSGAFNEANEHIEAFLQAHGKSSKGWLLNNSMRYREGVIEDGEWIHAIGERDPSRDDMLVLHSGSGMISLTDRQL